METIIKKEDIGVGFTYLSIGGSFTFEITQKSDSLEDQWYITNITPGYQGEGSWQSTKGIIKSVLQVIKEKQKPIGYETVVDLPGIPKGTKSDTVIGNVVGFPNGRGFNTMFPVEEVSDTNFFKPIYKAKQIVVDISGDRQVGIKNSEIVMIGDNRLFKEAVSFDQFIEVFNFITHQKYQSTKIKSYLIDILTFKLGCVELTREDISKIYDAIAPQLKEKL